MNLYQRIAGGILILLSLYVIITKPLSIVGEFPRLMGFLTILLIVGSCFLIAYSYRKDEEMPSGTLVLGIIAPIALIFGGMYNGRSFKNAKTNHLTKHGKIVRGYVTDKKQRSLTRKGQESNAYEIYFSYLTKEKEQKKAWEIVTDKEFHTVKKSDSLLIIYSGRNPDIVDLILVNKEKDIYKAKLNNYLENKE